MQPTSPNGEHRTTRGGVGKDTYIAALTAAGLSVAALAHPLLDVLADHPTFFAAHKADAQALTMFAAVATLATAAGGAALAMISRLAGGRIGKALSTGLLGCLLALICYRVGRQLATSADTYVIVASAVAGLVLALGQTRNATTRFIISVVGCASLLLVPAYFLTRTLPMVSAGSGGAEFADLALKVERPAPIVFVVFDALRLLELMDDDGRIDENSFPNFAKLSRSATWYRNTTTVAGFTTHAIPALLTGNFPQTHSNASRSGGPNLAAHPTNLFTMLAGVYDMVAEQPITDLCPADACDPLRDRRQIVRELMSDSLALLPYIFGTTSYLATLPRIDTRWTGFAVSPSAAATPRKLDRARSWVDALDRGETPRLYFLHTLLPHKPLRYTADGHRYEEPEPRLRSATSGDGYQWTEDVATVVFEHARYRMQAAAIDRLLGRLIERLEQLEIYDETLVVVTSDHGVAFRPGESHRHFAESSQAELLFVPLFIKAPAQIEGKIDDRPAQTIDVLPTLLELIGADHVEVDGRSLVDQNQQVGERFFVPPGRRDRIAIAETGPSSLPPRAVREANEHRAAADTIGEPRPERKTATAPGAMKDATVVVLPVTYAAMETAASMAQERAYFVHGFVMLEDPTAGWPQVELSLGGEPALLVGTFFSRETGRIVFEAIVQSTEQPEEVHETIDVALRWPSAGGTQARTSPRIVRTISEARSFLTTEHAFWFAFWQGHPASISCSESYRRAFLTTWRKMADDSENVFSLAQLIRRASATCREDDETVTAHVSDLEATCRCDLLESELVTPPSESAEIETREPEGSATWDLQWNGFAFSTQCMNLVKQRFTDNYQPEAPATWVRPPFVILRAAIESCRNEISVSSGADPGLCECFSFEWADTHDTQWANRWVYADAAKGPAMATGMAILETSKIVDEGPGR